MTTMQVLTVSWFKSASLYSAVRMCVLSIHLYYWEKVDLNNLWKYDGTKTLKTEDLIGENVGYKYGDLLVLSEGNSPFTI